MMSINNLNSLVKRRINVFGFPNMLVIGDRGSGKTYMMKREMKRVLSNTNDRIIILTTDLDEYKYYSDIRRIKVIELKKVSDSSQQKNIICKQFEFFHSIKNHRISIENDDMLWIYIDCKNVSIRDLLINEITYLAKRVRGAKICLTASVYPKDILLSEEILSQFFRFCIFLQIHSLIEEQTKDMINKISWGFKISYNELYSLEPGEGLLFIDIYGRDRQLIKIKKDGNALNFIMNKSKRIGSEMHNLLVNRISYQARRKKNQCEAIKEIDKYMKMTNAEFIMDYTEICSRYEHKKLIFIVFLIGIVISIIMSIDKYFYEFLFALFTTENIAVENIKKQAFILVLSIIFIISLVVTIILYDMVKSIYLLNRKKIFLDQIKDMRKDKIE